MHNVFYIYVALGFNIWWVGIWQECRNNCWASDFLPAQTYFWCLIFMLFQIGFRFVENISCNLPGSKSGFQRPILAFWKWIHLLSFLSTESKSITEMLRYYWDTYPKRILTTSFWSNIPDSPVHKQNILLISLCLCLDEWLAKRLGLKKKKAIYFLPWCALVHYTRNCFSLASFNWAYAGSFCFLNSAMEEFEVHIGFFFFLLNFSLVKVHYWARMRISSLIIYYPVDVSWTWIVASLMELVVKYSNFSPIHL